MFSRVKLVRRIQNQKTYALKVRLAHSLGRYLCAVARQFLVRGSCSAGYEKVQDRGAEAKATRDEREAHPRGDGAPIYY